MKIKELVQNQFIRKWVIFNWLGWFLGLVLGPLLFFILLPNVSDFFFNLNENWEPILISFPFGIGLGSMQQIVLRHWKVRADLWILATAFGIGIPATIISWILIHDLLGYGDREFLAIIAEILLMGLGIGGLQAFVIRRQLSKVSGWVWSYVLGFLALGITAIGIAIVTLLLAEPLEKLFYSLGFWQLVENRDLLLLLSIGIALPFLAVLFIGVPTGKILQRFDNRQITIENENQKTSAGNPAIY
jgi:hypothetical protein